MDSQTTVKMTASAPGGTEPPDGEIRSACSRFRSGIATMFGVGGLLVLHYALAARSLLQENPTVDEVVHMPAGITYWQKGTFRLYHHNPPLVKLVAALPVVWANPVTEPLYRDAELEVARSVADDIFADFCVSQRRTLFRAVPARPVDDALCSRSSAAWPSLPGRGGCTELWAGS